MDNAYVRLALRGIIAGISALVTAYAVDPGNYGAMVIAFLGGFATLAAAELATPINPVVGPGKDATVVQNP